MMFAMQGYLETRTKKNLSRDLPSAILGKEGVRHSFGDMWRHLLARIFAECHPSELGKVVAIWQCCLRRLAVNCLYFAGH